LRATTEQAINELKLIAHHLEEKYGDFLKTLPSPILLTVVFSPLEEVHFLIGPEGIKLQSQKPKVENAVRINYKDLLRVIENPSRAIRYLFDRRIEIYGNHRLVLGMLEKLL